MTPAPASHRVAGLCALAAFAGAVLPGVRPCAAGLYERGSVTLSVGASAAYTASYDKKQGDTGDLPPEQQPEGSDDYADVDGSVFLSAGYYVIDKLQVGLSLSVMGTWYPGGEQSDSLIYDLSLYAQYHFPNATHFTPFAKVKAGLSEMDTGSYEETGYTCGLSAGVEFAAAAPFTCFAELSTQYEVNTGDLEGREWRNNLYLGVSWFPRIGPRARRSIFDTGAAGPAVSGLDPSVRRAVRRDETRAEVRMERIERDAQRATFGPLDDPGLREVWIGLDPAVKDALERDARRIEGRIGDLERGVAVPGGAK